MENQTIDRIFDLKKVHKVINQFWMENQILTRFNLIYSSASLFNWSTLGVVIVTSDAALENINGNDIKCISTYILYTVNFRKLIQYNTVLYYIDCILCMSLLYGINILYGQSSVTWSLFIWSLSHLVNRSIGHLVIWSLSHSVTWSFGHLVIQSLGHTVTQSFSHSVTIFNIYTN